VTELYSLTSFEAFSLPPICAKRLRTRLEAPVRFFLVLILLAISAISFAGATETESGNRRSRHLCANAVAQKAVKNMGAAELEDYQENDRRRPGSLVSLLLRLRELRVTRTNYATVSNDNVSLGKASTIILETIRHPSANAVVLAAAAETIGELRYEDSPPFRAFDILSEILRRSEGDARVTESLAAALYEICGSKENQDPGRWIYLLGRILEGSQFNGYAAESLSAAMARLAIYAPADVTKELVALIGKALTTAKAIQLDRKRTHPEHDAATNACSNLARARETLTASRQAERAGNAVTLFVWDIQRQGLPARLPTLYIDSEETLYHKSNRFRNNRDFVSATSGETRRLVIENQYLREGLVHFIKYVEKNKHPYIPKQFVTQSGYELGSWCLSFRLRFSKKRLSTFVSREMIETGFVFDVFESRFEEAVQFLERYISEYGNADVPQHFAYLETPEHREFHLGWWISTQRRFRREGLITDERIKRLEALGLRWEPRKVDYEKAWNERFDLLKEYTASHGGDPNLPRDYEVNGVKLGLWVQNVSVAYANDLLRKDRTDRMADLGIVWRLKETKKKGRYAKGLLLLKEYAFENGHAQVPKLYEAAVDSEDPDSDIFPLGAWLDQMKEKQLRGELSETEEADLKSIGVIWRVRGKRVLPP
jgi:hypothetical protein